MQLLTVSLLKFGASGWKQNRSIISDVGDHLPQNWVVFYLG